MKTIGSVIGETSCIRTSAGAYSGHRVREH